MAVRLKVLAMLGFAALALPLAAAAHDDHDHDRARDLFERGEIYSLRDAMRIVAGQVQGDIVGVDLLPVGDHWVYRFQIVTSDGRRSTVDVDADAVPGHEHHEGP
jgi:uncharacterized membrane protein YkoI